LSKVRERFIIGVVKATIPSIGIVILGVVLFVKITSPFIRKLERDNEAYQAMYTERKKIQKDLEESEQRFRCFYEGAFEGIAITSNERVIDVNDRLVNMYGYDRSDIIGHPIQDFIHEDDHELVIKNVRRKTERPYELKGLTKSGEVIHFEVCGKQATYEGMPVRVTAIHDITDWKKAQEEIRSLQDVRSRKSKLEAIGNFAAGIAHDFNNALTPIIGNCDVMLHQMRDSHPCRKNVMEILSAAETASLLVHRILSFTRREKARPELVVLRLPGCLEEAFNFLRSIIPTSISMTMDIDPKLELVCANDVTIRQILMNLCKNSAQAMKNEEGSINISVSNEEILVERYGLSKGKYVKIEVEDDGEGMPPEVVERALDPYFTTKGMGEGTGIGLSVVNGIVNNYGGYIRIYSEVGRGTRVVLYIPAVIDEEDEEVAECVLDEEIIEGDGEHILLVDDEPLVINVSAEMLRLLNYRVTPMTNSVEALKMFFRNPHEYDVLLTDLTMPSMTGTVLISEVKKIRRDLPIILCSGLGSNGKHALDVYGEKAQYLTKPVTRRGYAAALAKVLGKS
jgi:PAS domain S-box-containing protein